jgi:catechol 2,3-dioxygenase-like lactoylglutathione lyase family enzyme
MIKLDHITLSVQDWRASRDWYVNNLGLKLEFEAPDGGRAELGVAALQEDSGVTLFLEQAAGHSPNCGCVHTFQVNDVEAKYRTLSASGVIFLRSPQRMYWGYGAELADPDGHILYLWDEKSMREKGGIS